jgi:hypothetical protein
VRRQQRRQTHTQTSCASSEKDENINSLVWINKALKIAYIRIAVDFHLSPQKKKTFPSSMQRQHEVEEKTSATTIAFECV